MASVIRCLSILAALDSSPVDRSLEADGKVPPETVALARLYRAAPSKGLDQAWKQYVEGAVGGGAMGSSGATEAMEDAVLDSGPLLKLKAPPAKSTRTTAFKSDAKIESLRPTARARRQAHEMYASDRSGLPLNGESRESPPAEPPYSHSSTARESAGETRLVGTLVVSGGLADFRLQRALATLAEVASAAPETLTALAVRPVGPHLVSGVCLRAGTFDCS